MEVERVSLEEKFGLFSDHWNPKVVGDLNGQQVKLVKFKGEFVWHSHESADELFLVIEGEFNMQFKDKSLRIRKGEFVIVPRGVEHRPVAEEEVSVLLFEPTGTINTGSAKSSILTKRNLDKI